MCGIVCVINANPFTNIGNTRPAQGPFKQTALLTDMLLASAVRGVDGTGMYQLAQDATMYTYKLAMPSAVALENTYIKSMVDDCHNSSITVGHVRAATQGSITDDNCHPFQAFREDGSYIIGVHNGTLYGWDIPKTEHEVDSAWAFDMLAKEGIRALDEMYGAFTFVWHDSAQPGKLFVARNEERPFHLIRSKDGKSMYAASEAGMLQWLVDKHKLSVEDDVYSLDTGVVAVIDTTKATLSVEKVDDFYDYTNYSYNTKSNGKYKNYTAPVPASSCPVPSTKYTPSPSLKDITIEAMKDCLRRARWSPVKDEKESEGPVEMGPVEDRLMSAEKGWFEVGEVDAADVKRAISEGLYGCIVNYDAVEYDGITDMIVGEIITPARLKSPIAYMMQSKDGKPEQFVDTQVPAVIVGARQFGDELEFIVTPLNEEGLKATA